MRLESNVALITGGATGIGLALAAELLSRGNRVAVCGRRGDKLEEACRRYQGLRAYVCDLREDLERRRLREQLLADGLSINLLVNNAAVMRRYDLTALGETDFSELRGDVETNFLAPIEMIRLFLPDLLAHPDAAVINVSTPGGIAPVAEVPVYCASKAALHSFTQSFRLRWKGRLRVVEVFPPSVDTPMMDGVGLPKVSPESFAKDCLAQLERDKDEIWIGQARYLPLLQRLAPRATLALVNRTTKFS